MTKRILTATVMLATLGLMACGEGMVAEDEASVRHNGLTWDEFQSLIYQEPGTGLYIVDGDTPIEGEKRLREFYDEKIASGSGALSVNRNGSTDDKWNDTQKKNLTYCVNKTKFGTRYNAVVQAMAAASGAWQTVADVKFVHVVAQDSNCTSSNSAVVFDVNPVNANGQYIARAFFPYQSRSTRNVLIDDSAFTSSGDPSLTAVLRHELGHTLGFRHEHTRPESGTCFEDNSWRALTPYDSDSVMHYPQCNGTGGWTLELTSLDAQGAASLYGAPSTGSEPQPEPQPTTPTETVNGTVAKGKTISYGPYSVKAGTTFTVVMSGSGDPDLYVRFGSKPTTSSYDCRPYKDGAAEVCTLTVPATASAAYIMVSGYTASTFKLELTYTKGGTTPTPNPSTGTAKSTAIDGSVKSGADQAYQPITVMAGTTFKVVMSGTGDADLYVRFGAQPTASSYHCRPYLDGSAETCSIAVPAGQTQAYVMVHGYTAATYHLAIDYTAP